MLTPSFVATQIIGLPSVVMLTDTSSGNDVSIVERRVFLVDANAQFLVPTGTTTNYVVWALADPTIQINCLTQMTTLNITVNWVDVSGATVVSYTSLNGFSLYGEQFYYGLTQAQTAQPNIIQDTNYYNSKMILRVELDSALQSIVYGNDIYGSQSCYNRATLMIQNQADFF